MKVRLLKRLRKKFEILYYPSIKVYKVDNKHYKTKSEAKVNQKCAILNYGRKHYSNYSKSIVIH